MQISIDEKKILLQVISKYGELPYRKHEIEIKNHDSEFEYIVPAEDKEKILKALWPFAEAVHSLDTQFNDLHSGKDFTVRDFRVIDVNINGEKFPMLASPEYHLTGGTVLDWIPIESKEKTTIDRNIKNGACAIIKE